MTHFRFSFFAVLFLLTSYSSVFSQIAHESFDARTELLRAVDVPNSPEAQAFTKYGDVDVSLYTGTPNVQVPIYTHSGRELDLPMALTYDASGIKVEQLATNVGLGWNLNIGGRISRIVNGFPDDYHSLPTASLPGTSFPYKTMFDTTEEHDVQEKILNYSQNNTEFANEPDAIAYLQFIKHVSTNYYDTQPDYFSFNALGISETFVIDVATLEARALNNPRIKAEYTKQSGSDSPITKWIITNEDGTEFHFEVAEITGAELTTSWSPAAMNGKRRTYNSSWLLTKIVSPSNKDIYQFTYQDLGTWAQAAQATTIASVINIVQALSPPPQGSSINLNASPTRNSGNLDTNYKLKQYGLSQISHNSQVIAKFNLGSRYDLGIASRVNEINIYSHYENQNSNTLFKSFDLIYSYFKTPQVTGVPNSSTNKNLIRLKLDEVAIEDKALNTIASYHFEYLLEDAIVSRTSTAQDYYGYYRGGAEQGVLYPATNWSNVNDGADRSPNFEYGKMGLLSRMSYPTGGYTEFEYEPHTSRDTSTGQGSSHPEAVFQGLANYNLDGGSTMPEGGNFDATWCNTPGCKDTYLSTGIPNIENRVFYISQDRLCQLRIKMTGPQFDLGKWLLIFKRDDITSCSNSSTPLPINEITGENNNFPGWTNATQNVVHYNNASSNYDYEENIFLEAGCYQIVMINPEAGSRQEVIIGYDDIIVEGENGQTSTTAVEKAGPRIASIKNYTDEDVLALHKSYGYSTAGGKIISKPQYEYVTTQYAYDSGATFYPEYKVLNRLSYVSGLDKPHIGYENVSETIVDYTGEESSMVMRHRFNTATSGNYRNGVWNYYINEKQTANFYSANYELGKLFSLAEKGTILHNDDTQSYNIKYVDKFEYKQKNYYQNDGVYLMIDESKGNMYPVPVRDDSDPNNIYYRIELVSTVAWSQYPGPGWASLVTAQPPVNACLDNAEDDNFCGNPELFSPDIGRASLQITKAYGNVGYMTNETKAEAQDHMISNGHGYLLNDVIAVETKYEYYEDIVEGEDLPSFLLKEMSTTKSNGDVIKKEFLYPDNLPSEYPSLITNNILNRPIQNFYYKNDQLLSAQKTQYDGLFPEVLKTAKGGDGVTNLEDRISYDAYRNGNIVQISQADGSPVSYIWGYNNRYVIAKLENITYTEIESHVANLQSISNLDKDNCTNSNCYEEQLRVALNNLRSIVPQGLVTTYTYDPLVGVTSITNPTGESMYYEYDAYHRLKFIRDNDYNILSKNEYNYRSQN